MTSKLSELALEYVGKYPEDWEAAKNALLEAIDKDAKLRRTILDEAVYVAVRDLVTTTGISAREEFWRLDNIDAVREAQDEGKLCKPGEETKPAKFRVRSTAMEKDWMVYPMENGKRIGDCTFAEMTEWGLKFIGIGNTYLLRGLCFQEIGSRGAKYPDAKVKDKMSSKALARIMESPRVPETGVA